MFEEFDRKKATEEEREAHLKRVRDSLPEDQHHSFDEAVKIGYFPIFAYKDKWYAPTLGQQDGSFEAFKKQIISQKI